MANLWNLPTIFVCENKYGLGPPAERSSSTTEHFTRADKIPGLRFCLFLKTASAGDLFVPPGEQNGHHRDDASPPVRSLVGLLSKIQDPCFWSLSLIAIRWSLVHFPPFA